MTSVNLQIFLTPFHNESRVLKETESLLDAGLCEQSIVVALGEEGAPEWESIDPRRKVWRVPLLTRAWPKNLISQILKYVEWWTRILFHFRGEPVATVQCHSLSSLPVAVALKWLRGARVIYDAHELETESNGLKGTRQFLSKLVERALIGRVDGTVVVGDAIADWYRDAYRIERPAVVRNIPSNSAGSDGSSISLKRILKIPNDHLLFICQGSLSEGRGIRMLLGAIPRLPPNRHVVFMGYGPMKEEIQEMSLRHANIHFHPAVPPSQVLAYTRSADVGLSLIENTCLSYYNSLPNKLFEYILSGIPVVVSDFPEMGGIVDQERCGWKVAVDEANIFRLLNDVTPDEISRKKAFAASAATRYSWNHEAKALLTLYRRILKS